MAERGFHSVFACPPGFTILAGQVTIGNAGAVSTQTGDQNSGGTVTKVAGKSGRYLITFGKTYKAIFAAGGTFIGPDDAAFPTTTGAPVEARLLTTSSFDAQFSRNDTMADADPASGTKLCWWAFVQN